MLIILVRCSAASDMHTHEGVAIKKVTNVFSKKILAKRALREIKLLQHFRGHRNVSRAMRHARTVVCLYGSIELTPRICRLHVCTIWISRARKASMRHIYMKVRDFRLLVAAVAIANDH